MPPARPAPPKMGLSGLLSILVLFIFLGSVQEHGLVEGFLCKYWGLSPLSRERNSDGRKEQIILTLRNASPTSHPPPPPQPGILGGKEERFLDSSFQIRCLRGCRKLSVAIVMGWRWGQQCANHKPSEDHCFLWTMK